MVVEKISKQLRWFVWTVGMLLVLIIGLCIWVYPIKYEFFTHTISDLGAMYAYRYTDTGMQIVGMNNVAKWIFSIGFVLLAIITIRMAFIYFKYDDLYADTFKGVLMILLSIGSLLVAIPWDCAFATAHMVGTLLFVTSFSIYNFTCQRLRYVRKHENLNGASFWKKIDNFLDLLIVIAVFILIIWYLTSGIMGILEIEKVGWLSYFKTSISQKILLMVCILASLLFDLDDM